MIEAEAADPDVEMGGDDGDAPDAEPETSTGATAENDQLVFAEEEPDPPKRVTFVDCLTSPVVELLVGQREQMTRLSAHQALLVRSPWFEEACGRLVGVSPKTIELPNDNLDAVGCFLEYTYTGEYHPRKLDGAGCGSLERDPGEPVMDVTGEQLLKHAQVYTLASKLQMPALRTLAHSKINCVDSTAKGEIA